MNFSYKIPSHRDVVLWFSALEQYFAQCNVELCYELKVTT
jgi:hypothetical protein